MKTKWDQVGEKIYETGVDHGVLYPQGVNGTYPKGVPWNGLINISENPTGAEANPIYADNIKYLNLISKEEFGATVEAYTYPDEFAACDGSAELAPGVTIGQQSRIPFGLSYRTLIGNDTDNTEHGYKIHLVYGAMAAPSEKAYASENDTPEPITFSWELTTTPVDVPGFKPSATVVLDSTKVEAAKMKEIEDILYGTDGEGEDEGTIARLPLPTEIATILGIAG